MGIRIKILNVNTVNKFFLFSIFLIISCKPKQVTQEEKDFIESYKSVVLYSCINKSTDKNFYLFLEKYNDLGLAPEVAVIFHSEANDAIKVSEDYSNKIEPIDYADYEGRKPIFSDCFRFANSTYIDSLAKKRFRLLKKSKLEYLNE